MTSQQYLLNQAEHCRRAAFDAADGFIAEELKNLAHEFEKMARQSVADAKAAVSTAAVAA